MLGGILGNSVQFSRRSSAIQMELRLSDARDLLILVKDSASGLTQSNLDDILGASTASAPSAEGADHSAGLRLARVLVEAHQGSLAVELIEGEGLIVQVTLPKSRLSAVGGVEDASARRNAPAAPAPAHRAATDAAQKRLAG